MCYSNNPNTEDLLSDKGVDEYLKKLSSMQHFSPFEHVSFTFIVEGISRACSHQLVRHRLASFSQRSQRYCSEKDFDYIVPPSIERDKEAKVKYIALFRAISNAYNELVTTGIPKEDARYVLPNACETRMEVTMNVRQLWHFFNLRCCSRAQWEIRAMANEMLKQCKAVAPALFSGAGASCVSLGFCPEGEKCCGKSKPLKTN